MPGVVDAERLAQAGQAERGGVARVAGEHRGMRRRDDEGRRGQVTFADPELDHVRIVAPAVGDQADLAGGDALDAGGKAGGQVGRRRGEKQAVHARALCR